MTVTASARGKANRAKGQKAEQVVAAWLRQWWPNAKRAVAAGWASRSVSMADPGDISGVPGVIWSVKAVAADRSSKPSTWVTWWSELDAMLEADPAALGVIVERRHGQADPAAWWAHLHLSDLVALHIGMAPRGPSQVTATGERDRTPVRIRLGDLVELLVAAGYARGAA